MGKSLLDGLEVGGTAAPVKEPTTSAAPAGIPERSGAGVWELPIRVEGIEVEAAVHGCLMRIRLAGNVCPSDVLPWLKALDPGVKVRDDFPKGKFGAFGGKETSLMRLAYISLKALDQGLFIELGGKDAAGGSVKVKVTKKNAPTFLPDLRALGRVSESNLSVLESAAANTGDEMVLLSPSEAVGVKYWTSDDKMNFLDGLTTELPAAPAGDGNAHE